MMTTESERISAELPMSTIQDHVDTGVVVDNFVQTAACALCRKVLSSNGEVNSDLEPGSICGDCKFLLLEDLGTPAYTRGRRRFRGRSRYSSSESNENMMEEMFLPMTNSPGQNQLDTFGQDDQPLNCDRSHTTPNGSMRWGWTFSDVESDGLDNLDSLYGESESNVSFGRYGLSHAESDSFSFSAYGCDSDASIDRHSFMDTGTFILQHDGSNLDSDTDIDPMHAGTSHWNSDDPEEEEGEEEEEEEEDEEANEEGEEETRRAAIQAFLLQLQNYLTSSSSEISTPQHWQQRILSPEYEGMIRRRVRARWLMHSNNILTRLEEPELLTHGENYGDYLDAQGLEDLLERLAESESSQRGAPPAAASFVSNLPCIVIGKEHEKHDGLACAICKDVIALGTEVNRLPCFHLYHPSCILPWLSARSSCPLCRYELPTDDKDYEEGKQVAESRTGFHEIELQNVSDDNSSEIDEELEFSDLRREQRDMDAESVSNSSNASGGGGRWLYLAAPIVSLVGIVLVLWLGNPLTEGRSAAGIRNVSQQNQRCRVHVSASPNQRENRSRRWWSLF